VSRILFVVPPLTGHINPASAVGARLAEAGHEVAWVGPESMLRPVLGPDATVYPTGMRMYRPLGEAGDESVRVFLETFVIPLARFTLAAVDAAVDDFRPDVLAVDQHAIAGALVAHRRGLRWATLSPTSMGLTRGAAAVVDAWMRGPVAKVWSAAGLVGEPTDEVLFSPYLQIGFTTRALLGPVDLPDHAVLVGPALAPRHDDPPFPWEWLDPGRDHVLVTVGTFSMDGASDFYRRVAEGLAPLGDRLQAILIARDDAVSDPPEHVLVTARAPVLPLMTRLDAVVSHGGLNTVVEALAHAVPLVVAPIALDQPVLAAQVAAAGAGVRVDYATESPHGLREAIRAVLDDPAFAEGAARVRDSFTAAGGAAVAAQRLAELAAI
jgi:MGT family glycosyltransferase